MLSSLRHVIRLPHRPTLLTRFASSRASSTQNTELDQLLSALDEEGSKSAFGGAEHKSSLSDQVRWKPFAPNRIVRPHELAYQSRLVTQSVRTKRPAVGPPSTEARYNDVFHQLNIDPLSLSQNPAILYNFISEMGKVYSRNVTGLTSKSQRRLGKAIRRAKMMGVIPILSKPSNAWIYQKRLR